VDEDYIEKPKRVDIRFIRNFMLLMGPISSIFDYLTFFLMLFVFIPMLPSTFTSAQRVSVFQTAWFIESLSTQTLVIFVLRTRKVPFYKSKPGKYLVISSLAIVAFAFAMPYIHPLAAAFHFIPPPIAFYPALVGLTIAYLLFAELGNKWFNKRYGYLLDQEYRIKKKFAK
jgi:Mg2+-importing ATPase